MLERRYKVAYIAHSVLFIVLLAAFLFTTDISFIQKIMINWMGKMYYQSLYDSFHTAVRVVNISLSGVVILEIVVFIFLPLLSIVAFVKEIREQFKEMKVKADFSSFTKSFITLVKGPVKDFRHTQNETYLILGKLLN